MSVFTDRVSMLIKERGISKSAMLKDLHMGSGIFATWEKRGTIPGGDTLGILAEYFQVSVDYLLGRTNDPVDYEQDGDALAQIPLSYVEACGGDLKRARAMMEAADADVTGERRTSFVKRKMPTAKNSSEQPKAKLRSISRLEDSEITPEQDEEISNYIEYLLSKRGKE